MTTADNPGVTAANDQLIAQAHTVLDLFRHLSHQLIVGGQDPTRVAVRMGESLCESTLSRETLAYLLAIVLVDTEIGTYRRRP